MAKNDGRKNGSSVPEGFNVKVGREDGDGWAKKEAGNTIQGRLMGRFTFRGSDGDERAFYQVQLTNPCKATRQMEEDDADGKRKYEELTLAAGSVVNIDEVAKLQDLREKCDDGGIYDVWLKFLGKKQRRGSNNTPWNFEGPYLKVIQAPARRRDEAPF